MQPLAVAAADPATEDTDPSVPAGAGRAWPRGRLVTSPATGALTGGAPAPVQPPAQAPSSPSGPEERGGGWPPPGKHVGGLLAAGVVSHSWAPPGSHPGATQGPGSAILSPPHQDRDPAAGAGGGKRWEALPPVAAGWPACRPVATWGCSHVSVEVLQGSPALTRRPNPGRGAQAQAGGPRSASWGPGGCSTC